MTKQKPLHKIMAMALTIVMLFGVMPTLTVHAVPVPVTTEAELRAALDPAVTEPQIVMTGSIAILGTITIPSGKTVTVKLMTTLTIDNTGAIENNGTLTSSGTIVNEGRIENNGGGLLVNEGRIENNGGGVIVNTTGGTIDNTFGTLAGNSIKYMVNIAGTNTFSETIGDVGDLTVTADIDNISPDEALTLVTATIGGKTATAAPSGGTLDLSRNIKRPNMPTEVRIYGKIVDG